MPASTTSSASFESVSRSERSPYYAERSIPPISSCSVRVFATTTSATDHTAIILRISIEPDSLCNPVLIRRCLIHKNTHVRSQATAYNPIAILLQPLDPSCHFQSVRKGFAISLPILIIYLLLYLLNFVQWESKLAQQYKSTVVRFWSYQRHEGFENVASLGTYVTSQFTHNGPIRLVIDSLVLIGVAGILGSVFNRRRFFGVYVLGGFLAAAADCAWARVTNPCRSLTQAQSDQVNTSARLINEAYAKMAELSTSQVSTMKDFVELLTDSGDFSGIMEKLRRQHKVVDTYYPQVRDWDRWTRPNWAASGSLVCLLSVAALIRPRTIINFMGVRPSVLLYKLTAGVFVFNLCMPLATNSRLNHLDCVGGNLAAVLLWVLWLRRGRVGALASSLRAFDKVNKPARTFSLEWWVVMANLAVCAIAIAIMPAQPAKKTRAQDSEAAKDPDPPQRADETGQTPAEEMNEDAANDEETKEGIEINQRAARDDDRAPENDKD